MSRFAFTFEDPSYQAGDSADDLPRKRGKRGKIQGPAGPTRASLRGIKVLRKLGRKELAELAK